MARRSSGGRRGTKAMRTKSGGVSAAARRKHGIKGTGKFPIFDRRSATSAIKLRGHAKSAGQRKSIINRAAKYAPAAAKRARAADRSRGVAHRKRGK